MIAEKDEDGLVFVESEDRSKRQSCPHLPKASRMKFSQAEAGVLRRMCQSDFQIQD